MTWTAQIVGLDGAHIAAILEDDGERTVVRLLQVMRKGEQIGPDVLTVQEATALVNADARQLGSIAVARDQTNVVARLSGPGELTCVVKLVDRDNRATVDQVELWDGQYLIGRPAPRVPTMWSLGESYIAARQKVLDQQPKWVENGWRP